MSHLYLHQGVLVVLCSPGMWAPTPVIWKVLLSSTPRRAFPRVPGRRGREEGSGWPPSGCKILCMPWAEVVVYGFDDAAEARLVSPHNYSIIYPTICLCCRGQAHTMNRTGRSAHCQGKVITMDLDCPKAVSSLLEVLVSHVSIGLDDGDQG